ncbi:hypothetical protein LAZ67_X001330 [Cordylochernes scorpioides]|uniref:Uncharacterized protein n=1 Tax=Cordylochernes scorpioides TaxID=51811 RepID=A0ABY6LSB7_9ARAC|nr:hypothetical protein LAZ67_X001330 [Cordylochernes scorpioides]
MKGRRYATVDEIKTASKEELKKILKNDFLKCFEDWKNRWHKCIISHWDYFEGDKIVIDSGSNATLHWKQLVQLPWYLDDIKYDCLVGLDVLRKFGFSIAFQKIYSKLWEKRFH